MPALAFSIGPLGTNSWLYYEEGAKDALVIDVGGDPEPISTKTQELGLTIAAILITHLHFDHVYGIAALAKSSGAPVFLPEADKCLLETDAGRGGIWGFPKVEPYTGEYIQAGERDFGSYHCRIIATPGHTPGSLNYYFPKTGHLFAGDTLFRHSVGRSDFPFGNEAHLLESIRTQLYTLPDETIVHPGHGPITKIGEEKVANAFCKAIN